MQSLFIMGLVLSLVPWSYSHSFYGVAPPDYKNKGDLLEVKVNKLSSVKTQLPYDYYSLSFCKPPVIVNTSLSIGQILRGDLIKSSVYNFMLTEAEYCKVACRVKLDEATAERFKKKINDEYQVKMILDNLPVTSAYHMFEFQDGGDRTMIYVPGFQIGLSGFYAGSDEVMHFIHNHLSFKVKYYEDPETDFARIVSFEVKPYSIVHEYKEWDGEKTKLLTCTLGTNIYDEGNYSPQRVDTDKEVVFTYDVTFESSDIKWALRRDAYLYRDDQVHWCAMINSLITVLFLSGVVAMAVMRTLYKDITMYNQLETEEEAWEETGWKLVHGEVFRPPINATLLCVCVGNGVQVFGMVLITMIFALLGTFSPSNRGRLNIPMVPLWMVMGIFGGYSSARLYKMFKGTKWKKIASMTAFMFPAICFGVMVMLNALIWRERSRGTVPFGVLFSLIFLWFGVSVPLVFLGSYFGFKRPAIEVPVKTNEIPRQIPKRAWHIIKSVLSMLSGGFIPFGTVFIEFFYIMKSIWLDQVYYSFGYLLIAFVILLVACCEMTILLCYYQLRSEDYNWWWRAYFTAGSSALYIFLYSILYMLTKLEIEKLVSVTLYFGYMLIGSFAFFVLTGTIGFYACFWFVRKIYASVKFD